MCDIGHSSARSAVSCICQKMKVGGIAVCAFGAQGGAVAIKLNEKTESER